MKTLLERVDGIDRLMRDLHKTESRLRAGQIIDGWREIHRILGYLSKDKEMLLSEGDSKK